MHCNKSRNSTTWGGYLLVSEGITRLMHGFIKQTQFCVSLSICGHKTRAFKHRKAFSLKLVIVPILTCGHESMIMTEKVLSQIQAAEMEFFTKLHGLSFRDKLRISVNPHCRKERFQLRCIDIWPECPEKDWRGNSCLLHPRESAEASWCDYISDLAWSCLVVEPPELPDIAKNRQTLRVIGLLSPRPYPEKKAGVKCEIQRSDRRGSDLA